MPRVIVTEGVLRGLQRCRQFLADKAPEAARRAAQEISRHVELLENEQYLGRPDDVFPELRELMIPFGDSGYVALYRVSQNDELVYVLAFRHQKEAGY